MSEALAEFSKPAAVGVPYDQAHREEIINELCARLTEGESLNEIVRSPDMPGWGTVWRWLDADPVAWMRYTRAREAQAHYYAQCALDVAINAKDAQLGRLHMDAYKWTASKLSPKSFGDSTQLRHADADGGKLDNSALVNELLALTNGQPVIESTARNVTPATPAAKPAFRPRVSHKPDDVSDLV